MKQSPLLLLLALVVCSCVPRHAYSLQRVNNEGTRFRQLQEQPGGTLQVEPSGQFEQTDQPKYSDVRLEYDGNDDDDNGDGGDDNGDGDNGDDEAGNFENARWCFPGSWNWPLCRDGGGGKCYPGSWNWPRCRYGDGCFPGSWRWPRCRFKL